MHLSHELLFTVVIVYYIFIFFMLTYFKRFGILFNTQITQMYQCESK